MADEEPARDGAPDVGSSPVTRQFEGGPYVLRSMLEDVPLLADGGDADVRINCVDYLGKQHSSSVVLTRSWIGVEALVVLLTGFYFSSPP